MLAGLEVPAAVEAERVITAVLTDLPSSDHRWRGGQVTASRWQEGREYDVTIVRHPCLGRDAALFNLESGRLCVLTSRNQRACVVVARAGIAELLDVHPLTEPAYIDVPVRIPGSRESNQTFWASAIKDGARSLSRQEAYK